MIRVDHTTVSREPTSRGHVVLAVAAHDDVCPPCKAEVLEHEPVALVGQYTAVEVDGSRYVDLSGAMWVCLRCAAKRGGD